MGAPRRSRPAPAEPTLFDLDALSVPGGGATAAPGTEPASAGGDWAAQVTVALAAHRSPRVRLSDEQVTRLLRILAAHDGQAIVESRLADLAELPAARIGRYLSQLQELVNIDSYGVLSVLGGEVRFDRALLDRQLGRP